MDKLNTTRRTVLTAAGGAAMLSQTASAQIGGDEDTREWEAPPEELSETVGSILLTEPGIIFDDGQIEVGGLHFDEQSDEQITTSEIRFTQS